jgi:hypothetical protein
MGKGLFKSVYGKTDEGIFPDLYSHKGSSPSTQRMDIRLGNYEFFGEGEEEEEDDEDEKEEAPASTPSLPTAPGGPVTGPSVFAKDKEGFPMWVVGIFLLGFAFAWRQRKKATTA